MKILVLGWYYSTNLGDAVLCDCVVSLLRRRFPQAQVVLRDMEGRQDFGFDAPFSMDRYLRERRRQRLRELAADLGWDRVARHEAWCLQQNRPALDALGREACDLVVFAGGQLFMDSLALRTAYLTETFTRRGIPVVFNACGTGPSRSPAIRRRLGEALTNPLVVGVTCRDDWAKVNRWCGREVAVPTADPALWAPEVYGVSADSQRRTVGLGVMLRSGGSLASQRRFWRRLIGELDRRGLSWKLFTNGRLSDNAFARELLASLDGCRGRETELLCPQPRSPEELVRTIAGFDSMISFRLHSHIIACSLGIPTVALEWDRKLPLFFEKIGHPERCLGPNARPNQILTALEQARSSGYDRGKIRALGEQARALLLDCLTPYVEDRRAESGFHEEPS